MSARSASSARAPEIRTTATADGTDPDDNAKIVSSVSPILFIGKLNAAI
jgi:hypothetical protein